MTIEQKLLGARQVALMLGVSKGSIYRLMTSRQIPYVAVGSRKMIAMETVKRFLADSDVRFDDAPGKTPPKPRQTEIQFRRPAPDPRAALMQAASALQAAAAALA